jgi:hypothetical protein
MGQQQNSSAAFRGAVGRSPSSRRSIAVADRSPLDLLTRFARRFSPLSIHQLSSPRAKRRAGEMSQRSAAGADLSCDKGVLNTVGIHRFKKVAVVLGLAKFSSRNSMASTVPMGERMRRRHRSWPACPSRPAARPCGCPTHDVDGREDALVGDLAVQDDFAVTGALELFERSLRPCGCRYRSGRWR